MIRSTNYQTPHVAARLAERRAAAYPMAVESLSRFSVRLSQVVFFGLPALCLIVWAVA